MTDDDASQRLLQSFTSMDELASYIVYNNPKKALYCVEISKGKACRKAKCIYPFSLAIQDA
jgi:hypothetical protein